MHTYIVCCQSALWIFDVSLIKLQKLEWKCLWVLCCAYTLNCEHYPLAATPISSTPWLSPMYVDGLLDTLGCRSVSHFTNGWRPRPKPALTACTCGSCGCWASANWCMCSWSQGVWNSECKLEGFFRLELIPALINSLVCWFGTYLAVLLSFWIYFDDARWWHELLQNVVWNTQMWNSISQTHNVPMLVWCIAEYLLAKLQIHGLNKYAWGRWKKREMFLICRVYRYKTIVSDLHWYWLHYWSK